MLVYCATISLVLLMIMKINNFFELKIVRKYKKNPQIYKSFFPNLLLL